MRTSRARLIAYLIAVLAPVVTYLIRLPLRRFLGDEPAFLTSMPAVMLAAYYGGLGPGMVATALSAAIAEYYLPVSAPLNPFRLPAGDQVRLMLFLGIGAIMSAMGEVLLRARQQLAAAQHRALADARAAGQRFRDLVNSVDGIVWEADLPSFQFSFVSEQAERVLGFPVGTWLSEPAFWKDHLHPDDRDWAVRYCQDATAAKRDHDFEYRMIAADGSSVWLRDLVSVVVEDDRPIKLRGVMVDVTKRKEAEAALRVKASLLNLTHDSIFVRDLDDVITYWNRAAEELYGWTSEQALGKVSRQLLKTIYPYAPAAIAESTLRDGRWEGELVQTKADGSQVVVASRWSLQPGDNGNPIAILETDNDITERRRAEEALRESEEQWRAVFENNPTMYFMVDAAGTIVSVNPFGAEQLGYTVDELVGSPVLNVFYEADREPVLRSVSACLQQLGRPMSWEFRKVRRNGSIMWVRETARAMRMKGRVVVLIVCEDVTERKRAEEDLKKTEQRLITIIASAPIILFALDRRGVFTVYEGMGLAALGRRPGDAVGRSAFEVYQDNPQMLANVRRALAGESFEEILHRNGQILEVHHLPFRDERGEVAGVNGVAINITERTRAEAKLRESESRYRNIFETAGVSIWEEDFSQVKAAIDELKARGVPDFRQYLAEHPEFVQQAISMVKIVDVNHATVNLFGAGRKDELLRSLDPILTPETREAFAGVFLAMAEGRQMVEAEASLQTLQGEKLTVLFTTTFPPQSERFDRVLVSIMNITERRAREAAEAANRAKDEFLANVSHEIRTPMNAILGMAEVALDTPLTDEQRNYLNIIKGSADGLLNLINDLLDLSKIEAGRMDLEEADFSLRVVLNETLRALALRAHKKRLELVCQVERDVPDGLVGDGNRLRQVLLNLVGNAIKFTETGEVIVRVRVQPDGSDGPAVLEFEVADSGIGIAPEMQQKIFRAFEQADSSTTRRYGGTGLGLTISSRLVEMMGGRIAVESEVGRGSTFRFTARFGRSARAVAAAPALPPVVDLRDLRVLVVDDNATNRMILEGWLRGWGTKPTSVADGLAAMSALWRGLASNDPFALLLLDARMPGANGWELARKVSQTPELGSSRMVVLTSEDRPDDAARYRALGITAVVMKPIQQEELLDTVYRVLSQGSGGPGAGRQAAASQVPAAAERATPRRLQVLVAEDNEFNQQVMQHLLQRRGHAVQIARGGRQALAALDQDQFDLLLLDVHMPEMDGFEVIKAVRARERNTPGHLPVIALTALSMKGDRERCIEAGMDDYLAKPVRASELYATIERLIGRQSAPDPASSVEPAPAVGPSPDPGAIDPATLLAACAGDSELLSKMIRIFQAEAPGHLAQIEAAVRGEDPVQLREAAHRLRGLISAFSTAGAEATGVLEQIGAAGRCGEAGPSYQTVARAVQDLCAALPKVTIEQLRSQADAAQSPIGNAR